MRCNSDRLIEALITTELVAMQKQAAKSKNKQQQPAQTYVVTISRDYGSMGLAVAQLLADVLEIRCCNRFILQEVARRAEVDEELVRALDEHVSKIHGHWWLQLLQKNTFTYEDYYQFLVKTILSISRTGGVIIGRGANLILGADKAFRVRITGSTKKCAARVAQHKNIDMKQAIKMVEEVNRERREYIRILYQTDINDPSEYDLVLNSDRYDRLQMVELILEAMEKAGYKLADDARSSLPELLH